MAQFEAAHYNILLAHILITPSVCDLALKNLQSAFFTKPEVGGTLTQSFLFEAIKHHHSQYGVTPDVATLITEFDRLLKKMINPLSPDFVNMKSSAVTFVLFAKKVDARSIEMSKRIIEHLVKVCTLDPEMQSLLKQVHGLEAVESVAKGLSDLAFKQKAILGTEDVTNVLSACLDEKGERVPTGIPFLDARLGRGAGPYTGCGVAIISPQGGGKTTLGIQLAISQCMLQKHTLLCLVEEGLTSSLRRNLLACTTGIPTTILEDVKDDPVKGAAAAGLDKDIVMGKYALSEKYLHVFDMTAGSETLEHVEQHIKSMVQAGNSPVYTYIDWAGMLADKIMSLGMYGRAYEKKYDALKAVSYGVARIAQQTNTLVCVAQQMAPEAVKKGPLARNDQFTCADCRGFTEPLKYVFVINQNDSVGKNPRAATGNQLFRIAKARNDPANVDFPVKLHGTLARFEDVGDQFELKANRIVKIKTAPTAAVPQEHRH